jgi:hypothetical protein
MWIAYDINMIPNAYIFVETWYKYKLKLDILWLSSGPYP